MKKFIATAFSALFCVTAWATTLSPIQLLNPTGSTSGQSIVSTGASTAPAWGNVSAAALTGILPVANGGTNSGAASGTALDNITGFASTGFLTRTGAGTYAFQSLTNGITYANLAQAGSNTLLGNATGSTANVASVTVTGCNGAAQALQWTNGSGFGCNSTIATSGANANITSLTGITTPIPVSEGGTGAATLTSHGVLLGEGTSAVGQTAAGTTGQVLVGSTGANPAFGTTVAGLTFTSAITPQSTGGIVGTTTNDSANAGSVGEYITATGSGVSLTNSTPINITSISLTAGDWDVWGNIVFSGSSNTTTNLLSSISTTSATSSASPFLSTMFLTYPSNGSYSLIAPMQRVTIATTTTVYLVANQAFSAGTMSASGYIAARRRR